MRGMQALKRLTVGGLLRRAAARYPERPALEYMGRIWTYRELDAEVDLTARRLLAVGVRRGDHVGIWCETGPNAIFALYAAVRLGAVTAMLNTSLHREELRILLERNDISRLLIGSGCKHVSYPGLCRGMTEEVLGLQEILYIGEETAAGDIASLAEQPLVSEDELRWAECQVMPEDTAYILYTSGTTGLPKAVMGSHFSRVNCGIMQAHDLRATEQDRFCVALPLFHCFCLSVNVMAACAVGGCLYIPESRRTAALLKAVSVGRCTVMSCVPALYHAMLCRPDFKSFDLSSLRIGFIGGCPYPPALFRQIEEAFGFTLLSSLGQTEATGGLTVSSPDDPIEVRAETVGHFMDHLEGQIVDPHTRAELPVGEVGEICVRGYVVMQGYYGQPKETAATVDEEGWLYTGDLGYLDGRGNLHLTGRLKDLIIRGGENISPAEIEAVAAGDTMVKTSKAIGVPDSHYGEEVCLCITPRDPSAFDEGKLRKRLKQRLAPYKVPKYILLIDELPVSETGKIQTKQLKAFAEKKLALCLT